MTDFLDIYEEMLPLVLEVLSEMPPEDRLAYQKQVQKSYLELGVTPQIDYTTGDMSWPKDAVAEAMGLNREELDAHLELIHAAERRAQQ